MENRCERSGGELGGHGGGVGRDGGLADYMLVPAVRYLVGIGDLDAACAAPCSTCAGALSPPMASTAMRIVEPPRQMSRLRTLLACA